MDAASIAVAMSGGVDSSVAAALLVEAGHRVFGLMLRLWSPDGGPSNRCCSPEDLAAARKTAAELGIPFYAIDVQDRFRRQVVDTFVNGYAAGVTPNPCLECNRDIRWTFLLDHALALGATHLATGHYARVSGIPGHHVLSRAVDPQKDQSYVLSVLGQPQLRHAIFPLGELMKPEVRARARRLGLLAAERPDSQDLCFLGGQDYRAFLENIIPAAPGPILDRGGNEVGRHGGLSRFTIGQRKGLALSRPRPTYVVGKDPVRNAVIVGEREELAVLKFRTGPAHWVSGKAPTPPRKLTVQVRYRALEVGVDIRPLPEGRLEIQADEPLYNVTPGQAAVLYDGPDCLGLGIIQP